MFLVDHINLDQPGTIKAVRKDGFISNLPFNVPQVGARISQNWLDGDARLCHFHLVFLQSGLRFSFPPLLEELNDYEIALFQLGLNS